MIRSGIAAILVVLLAGCATSYGPASFWRGGYKERAYASDTVAVSFRGNHRTSKDRVLDYLLYRCAEVTLEKGYDHFVITDRHVEARRSPLNAGFAYDRSTGFMDIHTRTEVPYEEFTARAMIKLRHGAPPVEAPGAYDAKTVMAELEPAIRIRR